MKRLTPDEVLLGLLNAQPAHGYELLEWFRSPQHLGRIWKMSTSQLYAVLKRLEESGLITGRVLPSSDAPSRTEYALTDRGEQRLMDWLNDPHPPISIHRIRVLFLSRLYIASLLDIPTDTVIARQLATCEEHRQRLQAELTRAQTDVETLTLNFMIGQFDAVILWLKTCQAEPLRISQEFPAGSSAASSQHKER
jgi:DNA-binding PadR family transcriptional regulator